MSGWVLLLGAALEAGLGLLAEERKPARATPGRVPVSLWDRARPLLPYGSWGGQRPRLSIALQLLCRGHQDGFQCRGCHPGP